MKKKLMCLALGMVALCSVTFSQVLITGEIVNGNVVNGTVTGASPNSILPMGTMVTFTGTVNGTPFVNLVYMVVQTPAVGNTGMFSTIANAIGNAFNTNNVQGSGGFAGNNVFGSNSGEYALQIQRIPLDLGLSAVLGAGAIAAVRTARKRKKEELANA